MVPRKWGIVAVSCALSLALIAGLTIAQEEKKPASKAADKEKVKGKLPNYFGQIGLSTKQQDDVRKAAQPFDEKIAGLRKQIDDLEKQIDQLDDEKLAACEKLLTDVQKSSLKERRVTAESEKEAKKKTKKTANGGEKKGDEKPKEQ